MVSKLVKKGAKRIKAQAAAQKRELLEVPEEIPNRMSQAGFPDCVEIIFQVIERFLWDILIMAAVKYAWRAYDNPTMLLATSFLR